jgi:hypothetical protein
MPRPIPEIARELNDNLNASRITTALLPGNVQTALALAVELAEGAAALEQRVDELGDTLAEYIAAHPAA